MADQIVITEKTSQAKDVRSAVGSRYGDVLAAEGHLFDLLEPEDVVPAWKRWSPILLRPEGLYGTRPAEGGNKAAKLKAIREALRTAKQVWLATDCDREGQLIGQEILEHYNYRGQVMRVLFTAQDSQTIRDAFGRAKPNADYAPLYAAAVARRQADQIMRGGNMTKSKPKTKRTSTPVSVSKSKPKPKPVTVARLKRAIEGRNARALAGLYAEDAVVQVIDRDNPPSKPRNLEGMSAISAYFDDVYGRDMTHRIESGIAVGKRLAFTQSCAYPDGTRVFCSAMVDLKGGKIARQIVVQAWDG